MGFFSDVKFLTNLFKTHSTITEIITELETECKTLKEDGDNLKELVYNLKTEFEEIAKSENEIRQKLDKRKQYFEEIESKNYMMQQLESIEYINTLISEKGYKMEKLDLTKEPFKSFYNDSFDLCYKKLVVLRAIKFKIQEFASQEGLCYEKLQKALFDINVAWMETYGDSKNNIVKDAYTTSLLLSSFMMLVKENSRKKEDKIIKHEVKKS